MHRPSYEAMNLLVCLFHLLSPETKNKLMTYVDGSELDSALHLMIREKLFPDWFCGEFCYFDPLFGTLDGLRYTIAHSIRGGSMELVCSAGSARYGLPMSEEECARWLAELDITVEQVRQWAQTLQQYLLEREKKR